MSPHLRHSLGVVVIAAAALVLSPLSVSAQTTFSDAKLEAFATAAVAVSRLIESWRPRVEGAGSKEEADILAREADSELRAAVEGTNGMTLLEYQDIIQALQKDPQLSARVEQIYNQKLQEGAQ